MSNAPGTLLGNDPVERFIHRLSIFEALEAELRDALRRAIVRGPLLAPMQDVHTDASQEVSVLLTGWLCDFRLLDNGRRQITSVIVPGDFVDFGFLAGSPSASQCSTTTPSQLGRVRARQFTELAEQFPSLMRASLKASATSAAISRERIISLGVRTATERLSYFLCELWFRLSAVGLVSSDGSYDLPMTQSEMGAALGLSTVHVNRTVQVLRRGGLVSLQAGKVIIHDPDLFASKVGFSPAYLNASR